VSKHRHQQHRLTSFPPSRLDAYYGNNHLFNPATFASSKAFWTTSLLSAQQLANSKLARQIDSRAYNPDYTFTATMEQFSLGELAAPIIAFGDAEAGTADRSLVEYFFGEFCSCVVSCSRERGWVWSYLFEWMELTRRMRQKTSACRLLLAGARRILLSLSRIS
jgi:hypothetical protein